MSEDPHKMTGEHKVQAICVAVISPCLAAVVVIAIQAMTSCHRSIQGAQTQIQLSKIQAMSGREPATRVEPQP